VAGFREELNLSDYTNKLSVGNAWAFRKDFLIKSKGIFDMFLIGN
jgi:hypothetical protein